MVALAKYREKRDFTATKEPKGGNRKRAQGNSFVIQKHDARRLHYDFRLEMDGVLKSWAVTRGPSLVAGEKRLAVHVEDHPLEYGDFEGTIPKGEYGGGTVIVWDRGSWEPVGDAKKGLAKGHLEFELSGEKLGGRWHLVRMAGKADEKRDNWLLIKADDSFARQGKAPDILKELPDSIKTGRDLKAVAQEAPGWSSKTGQIKKQKPVSPPSSNLPDITTITKAKKAALPAFVEPTLATLVAKPPVGDGWIHEIKFDGYRLEVRIEKHQATLLTRSGLDWTEKFGAEFAAAFISLKCQTALIDGEVVVETGSGASDFSSLQLDLSEGRANRFVFYAFDLLYLDGYDLRSAPLLERKQMLEQLLSGNENRTLRYSSHFGENGELVLNHACRLSLEGVVSKRSDSRYRSGRTRDWVKSKCSARQEFVIGGYMPSSSSAHSIGSLILGVYEGDKLMHVGRVGTGFSASVSRDLFRQLEALKSEKNPFSDVLTADERRNARFVEPTLVAEVEFRGWTADGSLRHASFRGIREDKPAGEIRREMVATKAETSPVAAIRTVKLTHPDRVYWPDEGVTKEGLADYYAEVWPRIAPFITGRALALLRCPEGIRGPAFFQKHAWKGLNKNIKLVRDPKDRAAEPLIHIDSLDGLMGLVQSAVLEIHPWGSRIGSWERPDTITMDLDPGPEVSWQEVLTAADEVRQRLTDAGLAAFVKTSGGKGLHVVSPLKPKANWTDVKAFTKAMADAMASDSPQRFVSTISKAKRQGKILIDYLRNQRGMTAVAPYSTRARPGAAVSMPLAWDDLSPDIGPAHFTIMNAPQRLNLPDPWSEFRSSEVPLEWRMKAKRS